MKVEETGSEVRERKGVQHVEDKKKINSKREGWKRGIKVVEVGDER